MTQKQAIGEKFIKLVDVMKRLRAPDGCPWDREQDYLSLRRYIIEEAYELIEAIENKNRDNICEECGDLLLQVVFVSALAEEIGEFNICNVMDHLTEKLIRRHPHVFGDTIVNSSDDVLKNWEQIKVGERQAKKVDSSLLAGIPRGLPGLLRAYRIQERAAKVGFDWPKGDPSPVIAKVEEELNELKDNITNGAVREATEEELGDLLFAVANLSRHLKADPETTLHKACVKFSDRFRIVEAEVAVSGREWSDFTLDELEGFWQKAKRQEEE
ncbi:MAG TPA: nucleoside triphosphate pyrophosphohydrolase [Synergistaceae bacterium]|jgi:XTP/dITP diphosphohydrolase/tetrapyrrole methylase family protein/MazG family protein/ATP diphosphatase|uniref:nucleoside triphosphate pyrophosphohydrolase n=1 Tax=Synergistaceae TaxID=649777 RepID=UPI000ECC5B46|nr:nucleoside triphosphate pyrophosphohydrolase [Synergistaceae bacterium DZ-S4]HAH70071.1 nucleoside triphosphate pyrophosphohydrolase [Synergistaceae bacterium]